MTGKSQLENGRASAIDPKQAEEGERPESLASDELGKRPPRDLTRASGLWSRRLLGLFLPLLTFVLIVVVWQVAVTIFHVPSFVVPGPIQIPGAFSANSSAILSATRSTLEESLLGFVLAAIAAIPLALAITTVKVLYKTLYPLLIVIQAIPKIALGPLFVIWFGFGLLPKVALVFLLTFFPILVASATGFKALDVKLLYLMRSMGASRTQIVFKLRILEALPHIFGGLEVGIVLSTTAALVAEFIGSNSGLGYLLLQSQGQLETPLVFAIIVIISAMGVIFAGVLLALKRLLMPWSRL